MIPSNNEHEPRTTAQGQEPKSWQREGTDFLSRILPRSWQGSASAKGIPARRQTRQFGCVGTSQDGAVSLLQSVGSVRYDVAARGIFVPFRAFLPALMASSGISLAGGQGMEHSGLGLCTVQNYAAACCAALLTRSTPRDS